MWKIRNEYKVGDRIFFSDDAFVYDFDLKKVRDVYSYHDDDEPWAGMIVDIPLYNFVVVTMCSGLDDILLYVDKVRSER